MPLTRSKAQQAPHNDHGALPVGSTEPTEVEGTRRDEAAPSPAPRKRARKSKKAEADRDDGSTSSSVPAAKKSRGKAKSRRRNLSLLPELPMDVLLEIFLLLDVKDLLGMARANKDFRRALVNPSMMNALWKPKREECEAPAPPSNFSEAKWLAFIFGSHCIGCGTTNVQPDWLLLKRACLRCRKQHLVLEDDYLRGKKRDKKLLECLLYSLVTPMVGATRGRRRWFWDEDIETLEEIWHSKVVENGARRAWWQVERNRQAKIDYVREVCEAEQARLDWQFELFDKRRDELHAKKATRENAQRFVGLGYADAEIRPVICRKENKEVYNGSANVTDRAFLKIREKFERDIQTLRSHMKQRALTTRNEQFLGLWKTWRASRKGIRTEELLTYPNNPELFYMPEYVAVRDSKPHWEKLDVGEYQRLLEEFPRIIASFLQKKRQDFVAQVPQASFSPSVPDVLELATSVFLPQKRGHMSALEPLIGWRRLTIPHFISEYAQGLNPPPALPQFSDPLSRVARSLVELSGLDPSTTTIKQMDELNERFYCVLCYQNDKKVPRTSIRCYTWRTALGHTDSHYRGLKGYGGGRDDDLLPTFSFLSNLGESLRGKLELEEKRLDVEGVRASDIWYCNHCYVGPLGDKEVFTRWDEVNLESANPASRACVEEHLKKRHGIETPREGEDYIFNESSRSWSEYSSSVLLQLDSEPQLSE